MKTNLQKHWLGLLTVLFAIACNDAVEFQSGSTRPRQPDMQAEPTDPDNSSPTDSADATPKKPKDPLTAKPKIDEPSPSTSPVPPPPSEPDPLRYEERFAASTPTWQESTYDFEEKTITQPLTLDDIQTSTTRIYQEQRQRHSDNYTQGHDGQEIVETTQLKAGQLDLAIIIDDSASMEDEQQSVIQHLGDLLSNIKDVDWRMGIATTTSSCMRPAGVPISSQDPDYEALFSQAIDADDNGDGRERGLERGMELLQGSCDGATNPWLRDDAMVAVLFISDEDSYCAKANCRGDTDADDFISFMRGLRPARSELLRTYALTWSRAECGRPDSESEGSRYISVIEGTRSQPGIGGLRQSLCSDFSQVLGRISQDVASVLERKVDLSYQPVADSIQVEVDGQPYPHYRVNGSHIRLSGLAEGAYEVSVRYLHDPVPKSDAFSLSKNPDLSTLHVQVNGQLVDPSMYEIADQTIRFAQMPPDSAQIAVSYLPYKELPKTFSLATSFAFNQVTSVSVDGAVLADDQYVIDWQNLELTLDTAPTDGSRIDIAYANDAIRHAYPVAIAGRASIIDVVAIDPASGSTFAVSYDGQNVVLPEAEATPKRALDIIFTLAADTWIPDFVFPDYAREDSLTVLTKDGATCTYTLTDQNDLLLSCPADTASVTVGYTVAEPITTLTLAALYPDEATITVLSGDDLVDFERQGQDLILKGSPTNPGEDLVVMIEVPQS